MGLMPWTWVADFVKTTLTGPIIGAAVDAYKTKIAAGQSHDTLAADLAGRELMVEQREMELQQQQNIADEGRWWTAAPRALVTWFFAIYIGKVVVWDKVLGLGATDGIGGNVGQAFNALMLMWFGGRSLEKAVKIWANRRW